MLHHLIRISSTQIYEPGRILQTRTQRHGSDADRRADTPCHLNDAVARASSETGIEARIILSTLRHYSTQQSLATVKLVERFKGTHVAGVDLGAYKAGFPIEAAFLPGLHAGG